MFLRNVRLSPELYDRARKSVFFTEPLIRHVTNLLSELIRNYYRVTMFSEKTINLYIPSIRYCGEPNLPFHKQTLAHANNSSSCSTTDFPGVAEVKQLEREADRSLCRITKLRSRQCLPPLPLFGLLRRTDYIEEEESIKVVSRLWARRPKSVVRFPVRATPF
jgi:hypothetical protein